MHTWTEKVLSVQFWKNYFNNLFNDSKAYI